ncbi:MAG: DedA family protein [Methylococcaceae bacterium]|nr:DedA family protein [Methylococcaceae bacterium]
MFFERCYESMLLWAQHRHAVKYLFILSFAESSFFPLPPDVMLAPMSLSQPKRALFFALLTTVASVLGGVLGYMIGLYAIDWVMPWLQNSVYGASFIRVQSWFEQWGVWAVFLAGFSPIPYKVFTIASGAFGLVFLPFVIASILGRGARFFLVAGLIGWGGERLDRLIRQYMNTLGWLMVCLVVMVVLGYQFFITLN